MKIEYISPKVEEYFTDWEYTKRKCNIDVLKPLKRRFEQIKAAETLAILNLLGGGHTHLLTGNMEGHIAINVTGNLRLICKIKEYENYNNICILTQIMNSDTIIIVGVCDYHGAKIEWVIP